jgi:ABC-2 type transport system ATP-binding protein
MSIVAEKLVKKYGDQKALDEASFQVKAGEVVGFLGPNGAGKSTMMKILTGYISPDSGKAWVNGHDVLENSLEARKNMGYLPETNPLYPEMYVKEYLRMVAGIYKIKGNSTRRVSELIEMTGLGPEQHKKAGALSKGYKQRLGLAQALLHDPGTIILDEPTSGLDPNQIVEIRNLIAGIGKKKTVLLSTHIMQEVEAICDRAIIIHQGKIVADGPIETLARQTSAKTQLVRVEFKEEPDPGVFKAAHDILAAQPISPTVLEITGAEAADVRPRVFELAVKSGYTVLGMQEIQTSLEDVFQQLTGK